MCGKGTAREAGLFLHVLTKSAIEDFIFPVLGVGVHALVRNDAKSELQKPAFAVGGNDAFLITLNPKP